LISLIEFPITEREEIFQVSFAYLTDKIEVSSVGSGRNPTKENHHLKCPILQAELSCKSNNQFHAEGR